MHRAHRILLTGALLAAGLATLTVTSTIFLDRASAAQQAGLVSGNAPAEIQPDSRDLPNLTWYLLDGWDFEVIPRDDHDTTVDWAPLPPILPGNEYGTYLNCAMWNASATPTPSGGFVWRYYVDDINIGMYGLSVPLPAWEWLAHFNYGPEYIRGGRRTFEVRLDADHDVTESNEFDNNIAYQFVWTPYELTIGDRITRSAPADRVGGWGSIPGSEIAWYNCDGLRFATLGWWNAVWIRPENDADDFDCRLHAASTGSRNGFTTNVGASNRPAGYIDGVIANRNTLDYQEWDVGVISNGTGESDYDAEWVQSVPFSFGNPLDTTVPYGQAIQLWEFNLDPAETGLVAFVLETEDPLTGLWLYYYDNEFTSGGIEDHDGFGWTVDGLYRGFREITEPGFHCVAIIRDPFLPTGYLDYRLIISPAKPDFTPNTPSGWHSACVPRPDTAGAPTGVDLPDTLHGNSTATYPNLAMRNDSQVPCPDGSQMAVYWEYDEQSLNWVGYSPVEGWDTIEHNGTVADLVPGGRHTYTLRIDKYDVVDELDEEDNFYGEQYCWSPLEIELGTVTTRDMPADRTAGWNTIGSGELEWYNCDGLRLPGSSNFWSALAVLPVDASDDVDVRLHEVLVGVKDGFAGDLDYSDFGAGESDFVLVNFNETSHRAFDVGVVTIAGEGTYRLQAAVEQYLGYFPDGTYGPYEIVSGNIVDLHEMYLEAGEYQVVLDNQSGSVSLGMTLHVADAAYMWKGQYVTGGMAFGSGPGAHESFAVTVPANDFYCLSVWKEGSADLSHDASYQLHIHPDWVAVPETDQPPSVTRLAGVYPNPFNPQTMVAFDLARETFVDLCVYDVGGRKVRTLVAERTPAGRFQVRWDGKDDHGAPVSSGVYLARLIAGEVRGVEKMVLIK